jgi:hypothetical protein
MATEILTPGPWHVEEDQPTQGERWDIIAGEEDFIAIGLHRQGRTLNYAADHFKTMWGNV